MPRMNKDGTIRVSGGEQICLWFKSLQGTWKKYYEQAKNDEDINLANGLEKFELKHKIKFVVKDLNNISFKSVQQTKRRKSSA